MREDSWLSERLGRPAYWADPGDRGPFAAPAFWQAKVDAENVARVAELESQQFRVVDLNLTLARGGGHHPAPELGVEPAEPGDHEALLEIAERHYERSRFHLDPEIPNQVAGRIKRDWLQACLEGARGDRVLAARVDRRAVGFLAAMGDVIDLVAVHPAMRGQGIGQALVAGFLTVTDGVCTVGTQAANTGALRFYERLGFCTVRARYVLHLHAR